MYSPTQLSTIIRRCGDKHCYYWQGREQSIVSHYCS
jgi:hypothetical protein